MSVCHTRLVDNLRTHWTDSAVRRNFLSQTMQTSVPPGCEPLVQVTDTGFSQAARAAGRAEHERQRRLRWRRAREQKTESGYQVGSNDEILEIARAMHQKMVQLNETKQTVLAQSRECGWLHWRPDSEGHRLVPVAEQQWAKPFPECSFRLGQQFSKRRPDWVVEGRPREGNMMESVLKYGQPSETTQDYFEDSEALEVEGTSDYIAAEDRQTFYAVLQHPRYRTQEEAALAEQALLNPLAARKQTGTTFVSRAERASKWRAMLGSKALADRLQELPPTAGKARKQQLKRSVKKMILGGSLALSLRRRLCKAAKLKERALAARCQAGPPGPLTGKTVRCLAATATYSWRNSEAQVMHHDAGTEQVTLRLRSTGTLGRFRSQDVAEWSGPEKAALPAKLCLRRTSQQDKFDLTLRTGSLTVPLEGQMLEAPELLAAVEAVRLRGRQSGDHLSRQTYCLNPYTVKNAVRRWEAQSEDWEEAATDIVKELQKAAAGKALVLVPVHTDEPEHWTALVFRKTAGNEPFTARHFDSLHPPSAAAAADARAIYGFFRQALGDECLPQPEAPDTETPVQQTDAWSCGWHTLARFEEAYREFRGEGPKRVYETVQSLLREGSRWIANVRAWQIADAEKKAEKNAGKPKPTPATIPIADAVPATELPTPALLESAKSAAPDGVYGCSRCRYSYSGCLSCNPSKMLRASAKGSHIW